ncbi:MAG: insulinase family protein [Gammaproteobacteria bacterium]|nr:insulinase family protein [Gammaproteobacteria bacterium]
MSRLLAPLLLIGTMQVEAAPQIEHWTTANGAQVYFVAARELPMVDIRLVFDAGSARDGSASGLAQLSNSMIGEGAAQLDADAIAEHFARLGSQLDQGCDRDMAMVTLRSLSDPAKLRPSVAMLTGLLGDPSFPDKALERTRRRMLTALQAEQQSPEQIAERTFYQALYGAHPYAASPLGSADSVKKLSRQQVRDFFQRYYVAHNMLIALVGDLDRDQAGKIADQISAALQAGEPAAALPEVPDPGPGRTIHVEYPSNQTHIVIGMPVMARGDADYFSLYTGNHSLGGSGLVSRISDEIREKRGLAYSAYSYFMPLRRPGPFIAGLQTRNDQAAEALRVLQQTINDFISDGPRADEVQASQQNITGGFPLRLAGNRKIVENLALIGFYQLPLDYLDTFSRNIDAVRREQIRDAFRRRLDPQRMIVVTVGPSAIP